MVKQTIYLTNKVTEIPCGRSKVSPLLYKKYGLVPTLPLVTKLQSALLEVPSTVNIHASNPAQLGCALITANER